MLHRGDAHEKGLAKPQPAALENAESCGDLESLFMINKKTF